MSGPTLRQGRAWSQAMPRRSDVGHPVFARLYAHLSPAMEQGVGGYRRQLLAGLSGTVVEEGAGDGMNFAHYPRQVERVVAVEPEPYLRKLARRRAQGAPVPVEVVAGRAEELPLDEAAVDAAVASLVLCSVVDPDAALAELVRVVRPGGQLRVLEHVRAQGPVLGGVQRLLDVVWPVVAGGCHQPGHGGCRPARRFRVRPARVLSVPGAARAVPHLAPHPRRRGESPGAFAGLLSRDGQRRRALVRPWPIRATHVHCRDRPPNRPEMAARWERGMKT